jgi:hypothetical protein
MLIGALIIAAGLGLAGWLSNRLMRWARSGSSGAQALGSILTEVTQSAFVHEAKEDKKRKNANAGDPPNEE